MFTLKHSYHRDYLLSTIRSVYYREYNARFKIKEVWGGKDKKKTKKDKRDKKKAKNYKNGYILKLSLEKLDKVVWDKEDEILSWMLQFVKSLA